MTPHDEHWTKVKHDAEARIGKIFEDSGIEMAEVVGHYDGVTNRHDLKEALGYVFCHGNRDEKTCAMMSACEWLQAANELAEKPTIVLPAAGAVGR